ncbi:5-formyltetrahydrofolate cyclo-ligase [Cryptococcus depauperatus]
MSDLLLEPSGSKEFGADMSTTFALKSVLRRSMLQTLRNMSSLEVEKQSQKVFEILLNQPFFKTANTVGCYLSMAQGELQTVQIVDHLLCRGSSLYTPYIPVAPPQIRHSKPPPSLAPQQDMHMLRLYSSEDLANCPLDKWGIVDPGLYRKDNEQSLREDAMDRKSPDLDLILIPGVAFDKDCNRLGRGKAYYDRFLQVYTSSRPRPLLVAIALGPQILPPDEKVPITESDFQLDGVISPSGIIWREDVRPA